MTRNDLIQGFAALLVNNTNGDIQADKHLAEVLKLIQNQVNTEDDTFDAYALQDATRDVLEDDSNFLLSGLMKSPVQAALSADQRQVGQLHVHRTKAHIVFECTWNGNWIRKNLNQTELKATASWDGNSWSITQNSGFLNPSVNAGNLILLVNNPDDFAFGAGQIQVEAASLSSNETLLTAGYFTNFSATTSRAMIAFQREGVQVNDLSTLPNGAAVSISIRFNQL
ncbi:MAG: hypothetical protein AAF206_24490 [Bacteroidota bacterium]